MSDFPASPDGQPMPPQKASGRSTLLIVGIVLLVLFLLFLLLLVCSGVLAGLLLPAVARGREAARLVSTSNNMRAMGTAMLNYEANYKYFPAGIVTQGDGSGKPFGSINLTLAPFLGVANVNPMKAWDDPENKSLGVNRPAVFDSPLTGYAIGEDETTCFFIVDPKGALRKDAWCRALDVTDGLSTVVVAIDAGTSPHPWHQPDEVDIEEARQRIEQSKLDRFPVLMMDSSVRIVGKQELLDNLPRLVDITDGK
jgi:hypothetical protein